METVDQVGELLDAVADAAAAHGGAWFPDLHGGPVRIRLRDGISRSRCHLYAVELTDGVRTRPVMVKVRHSDPTLRREDRFEDRRTLAPVRTMPDRETARREYDGLVLIQEALDKHGDGDERFGAVRPLAWIPEHSAMVLDLVEEPTLRTQLLCTARPRIGRSAPMVDRPWRNAGAWLRLFHEHPTTLDLPLRVTTSADVGDYLGYFTDFLVDRLGPRPVLSRLRANGGDVVRSVLPDDLPLGTGHGDFVANNMFVSPAGRITVFDPLPMWQVPVFQDLATMAVGLRLLTRQAVTQGLALPRAQLDRYESALHQGYFGSDPVPLDALRSVQLVVLLDRWASLVSRRSRAGGLRSRVSEARVRLFSRHYEDEVVRLTRQLGV